jgi:hypothetical protein
LAPDFNQLSSLLSSSSIFLEQREIFAPTTLRKLDDTAFMIYALQTSAAPSVTDGKDKKKRWQ